MGNIIQKQPCPHLRDEDTQTEITLQIPQRLCDNLKDGNLVQVGGVLGRRAQNNCHIQLMLVVSRIDVVQEQAIDASEIKKVELRQKKALVGFKNVDSILEQLLFQDKRPKVALVFAKSSITMSDFEAGINAAKTAIDFTEQRVNFSNCAVSVQKQTYSIKAFYPVITPHQNRIFVLLR